MEPLRDLGRSLVFFGGLLVLLGALRKIARRHRPSRRTHDFLLSHRHLSRDQRRAFSSFLAYLPIPPLNVAYLECGSPAAAFLGWRAFALSMMYSPDAE